MQIGTSRSNFHHNEMHQVNMCIVKVTRSKTSRCLPEKCYTNLGYREPPIGALGFVEMLEI